MWAEDGALSMYNVTFFNNTAALSVGTVQFERLKFSILNCTFESNSAQQVGCVFDAVANMLLSSLEHYTGDR